MDWCKVAVLEAGLHYAGAKKMKRNGWINVTYWKRQARPYVFMLEGQMCFLRLQSGLPDSEACENLLGIWKLSEASFNPASLTGLKQLLWTHPLRVNKSIQRRWLRSAKVKIYGYMLACGFKGWLFNLTSTVSNTNLWVTFSIARQVLSAIHLLNIT